MRAISLALLFSLDALAGPAATRKALSKQGEASELIDQLAQGTTNPNTVVNKLKYLGQESYGAHEIGNLFLKEIDAERRRNLILAVAGLAHRDGEGALVAGLGDTDGPVRMYSAQGLGRIKSRIAVPRLVGLLADPSLGVRREAARALGLIGVPKVGPALVKAAKAEDDPETRSAILLAIGQSGDKRQIPTLEAFLKHSSESSRFSAAAGLCVIGAPAGHKFARELLESKDRFQRMQGLLLFEGSRASEAAPVLEPLLKDPDRALQAAAARILVQGGDKSKLDWLVLRSFETLGDERLPYEKELETLRLTDDDRRAILKKAGIH